MKNDAHLLELLEKMAGRKCKPEGELHLCSLVEAGLCDPDNAAEWSDYLDLLAELCSPTMRNVEHSIFATWQQRTAALAELKEASL